MSWCSGDMRRVHHPKVTTPGTSTSAVFIKYPYTFPLLSNIRGHTGCSQGDMRTVHHPIVTAPG